MPRLRDCERGVGEETSAVVIRITERVDREWRGSGLDGG
jgi:hypothetical protein